MIGLWSLLVGCIPLGALDGLNAQDSGVNLVDSADPDTEPSAEPSGEPSIEETGDAQDTLDTQDTNTVVNDLDKEGLSSDPNHNYGRRFMSDWHMVFDGSVVLKSEISRESTGSSILDFSKVWGVGLTIAPSNEDVFNYMFGQFDNGSIVTLAFELPLFEARNRMVSLHFESLSSTVDCDHRVRPLLKIRRFNEDGSECDIEVTNTEMFSAESSDFLQQGLCVDDVAGATHQFRERGFQVFVGSYTQAGTIPPVQQVFGFFGTPGQAYPAEKIFQADLVDMEHTTECSPTENNADVSLYIGHGRKIDNIDIFHLNARVDNIVLLEPYEVTTGETVSYRLPVSNLSDFWFEDSIDLDYTGTDIYQTMDFRDSDNDDGFSWFSFEHPLSSFGLPISGSTPDVVPDASMIKRQHFSDFVLVDSADVQTQVTEPYRFYYFDNNNQLSQDLSNWLVE